MNTKKILLNLSDMEDLIFAAMEYVEEENWDSAISSIEDVASLAGTAIEGLESIEDGEVEDE